MKRGSAVYSGKSNSAPPNKKRKLNNEPESSLSPEEMRGEFTPGQIVHEDDEFQFEYLYNDAQKDHLIALCDLKQIFAACLPRMGTRYVTRHVFDEHHRLLCCRSKISQKSNGGWNRNVVLNDGNINPSTANYPIQYPVIGGMCIRPFYEQHFGEVVFLAVHNQHQHKSVGRKIMRVMKAVAVREGLNHFYTYADNQAIGFFTKMGFNKKQKNKSPSKTKELFWDYIKHYTGSELMESKLYKNVDYIKLDENLLKIEKKILSQIKKYRKENDDEEKMNIIHEPCELFKISINEIIDILELDLDDDDDTDLLINTFKSCGIMNDRDLYDAYKANKLKEIMSSFNNDYYEKIINYLTTPNDHLVIGHIDELREIEGVNPKWMKNTNNTNTNTSNIDDDLFKRRSRRFDPVQMKCSWIIKRIRAHDDAFPFHDPVSKEVEGYYERIKHPIDLQTMQNKIDQHQYLQFKEFDNDFKLMIANCKQFNEPNSEIVHMAMRLNAHYQQLIIKHAKSQQKNKLLKRRK